jgi:hypothetical protein
MRNTQQIGNSVLKRGIEELAKRLPSRWSVASVSQAAGDQDNSADALLEIRGPDGTKTRIIVEAKRHLTAAGAVALIPQFDRVARHYKDKGIRRLVLTTYLSPLARDRLRASGISYLDLTGNIRIELDRPALFIESRGADRNPTPQSKDTRTLKGGSAARIVRALCDWRPPVGVRQLARRAEVDPGYVTRVLVLLASEDVIARDPMGAVATVRWQDLLRRWAQDYSVARTNRAVMYLEPRGPEKLLARLRGYSGKWALTGSRAVPPAASTAASRSVSLYVDAIERAAGELDLRTVDAGANVLLLEPFDLVVWERMRREAWLNYVGVSQCVVDLLTGIGREPAEGEALLSWMDGNESEWRA